MEVLGSNKICCRKRRAGGLGFRGENARELDFSDGGSPWSDIGGHRGRILGWLRLRSAPSFLPLKPLSWTDAKARGAGFDLQPRLGGLGGL